MEEIQDQEFPRRSNPEALPDEKFEPEPCENVASAVDSNADFGSSIPTNDISELQDVLIKGSLKESFALSSKFWDVVHSKNGSIYGYVFGFMVISFLDHRWMAEEIADTSEGHQVAKTFVVLFILYVYSFITLGLEIALLLILLLQIFYPARCKKLQHSKSISIIVEAFSGVLSPDCLCLIAVVTWCGLAALLGSCLWQWFWWNHICKSYHDRSCRASWLGQLVIQNRNRICHDENTSDLLCERLLSYLPIMVFCILTVFVANLVMPLINNALSKYFPASSKIKTAFELMDQENEQKSESSFQVDTPDCRDSLFTQAQMDVVDQECVVQEVLKLSRESDTKGIWSIVPVGLGVVVLFVLDWLIVKNLFP